MYKCEVCGKLVMVADDAYKMATQTSDGYTQKEVCRKCAGFED